MPRSFTAPREASAAAASAGAGAMRGGGGRQPFAAPEGSDAAAIPAASRKTQDTFHEVTRKRDKKMEPKAPSETRPRTLQKSTYEGYKTGSDRSGRDSILHSVIIIKSGFFSQTGALILFFLYMSAHSVGVFRGAAKKEPEFHAPLNSSALDVKTTETISATRNIGQADAENTTSQPPSQAQHGWGGIPGRPSMAEIVKMGRPQAKVGRGPVASSTAMPAIGDSVISKKSNHTSKQTVFASEFGHGATDKLPHGAIEVSVPKDATSVDMLPLVEGTDVEASSMSAEAQGSSTLDIRDGGIEKDTNLEECTTENLTVSGQFSASGEDIQSEYTEVTTHQDDGSIEKTDDFHSNDLPFEDNQNLNGDLCTTAKQIDHLTLHEGPKLFDDNPAVIIPDHLGVSNADCAHLMFGTFLFGTLDASLTTKPLDGHGDVATVLDDHSIDTPDVRIYEDESKEEVTLADNMENLDVTMAQQSEVTRANFLDVTNNTEFNLSSTSDYGTSSAALQDSASHNYLQVEFSYSDLELENFLCRWVNEGNTDLPVLDIYAQKAEELGHNRVFLVNLREAKNSSKAKPKYNRTSDGGRWKKSHPLKNVGCTRAKKDKYNYCRDGESESSNISLYEYTLVDGPKDQVLCHILYNAQSAPEIRKKPKKGSKNDPHVPEDDKDIEEETQRAIEELRKEAECLRVELKQARDDRDHSVSQLNSLNIELADYKEHIGKSSKQHERLRRKVSELEATLNRQREQIQTLQKQLAVTTEKLKLAEVEAMTIYEEQNEKRKNLEVRLAQAESQIVEGDKYRKELQNTILELEADMCARERGLGFSRLREGSRQRSGKPPFVPREHRCN